MRNFREKKTEFLKIANLSLHFDFYPKMCYFYLRILKIWPEV